MRKKMRKTVADLLPAMMAVMLIAGCAPTKEAGMTKGGTGTYADYVGRDMSVATIMGDVYGVVAEDVFGAGEVREFSNIADVLENLRLGRVDAALIDNSYVKPLVESGSYPEFEFLWVPREVFVNESASVFRTEELRDQYNEWLAGIAADGILEEITGRWIGVPLPEEEDIPRIGLTGGNGTLRVCDTGDYPPFTYYTSGGEHTGFDHEMVSRFAQHMGMDLEVVMTAYDAVLPTVISGKADMSACVYTITEERGEGMFFGDPCIVSQGVLVVNR